MDIPCKLHFRRRSCAVKMTGKNQDMHQASMTTSQVVPSSINQTLNSMGSNVTDEAIVHMMKRRRGSQRWETEESPFVFKDPSIVQNKQKTRNKALYRLSQKLIQITQGKEVNNYLDADLDEVSKLSSTLQCVQSPAPKDAVPHTLQNALASLTQSNGMPQSDIVHENGDGQDSMCLSSDQEELLKCFEQNMAKSQ